MITREEIFAGLDSEDHDLLATYKWYLDNNGYIFRSVRDGKKKCSVRLHRLVLARIIGRSLIPSDIGDHINRNRIDNRRSNLRVATRAQNSQNSKTRSKWGYKGVSFDKKCPRRPWRGVVDQNGHCCHLGQFDTVEHAAEAVRNKRKELGIIGD